jgi:GH15 family glucan-1,4-alpha-glucosidase
LPKTASSLPKAASSATRSSNKLHATRPIGDYALISSTHSAALVHRGGDIEWLCLPRFDSAAMFASLLGVRGTVSMHTELRIRFNYGEWCPWVERRDGAVYATAGPDAVRVTSGVPLVNENFASFADFSVSAGQSIAFCLEWFPSHQTPPVTRDANALLSRTVAEWNAWTARSGYQGEFREPVMRSLLTLKALTYEPTGGIVAAPSTSLPELPGGERNWDYRFCWLRDAALTLYALLASGYVEEASAWRWWLMRAVGGSPEELQVMYGLHGERSLTELELGWLPGYEGSRPVRIGNGAHGQRQLDVYGSVIAAFHAGRKAGLSEMDKVWPLERAIAKQLMVLWKEPDCSLWEVRGEPRHFVHSKMMCWLAFDRMIASATEFGLEGPVDQWRAVRDEIHAEVCARGYDAASNSFVQYYGADTVDAALLWMPLMGFLPIHDPRVQGTIARIEKELIFNGLVYRYRTEKGVDGLEGGEGAFLACSFWLSNVYVAMGKLRKARALFKRLLALGNDLGLFAEEYDPVGKRQLGNFPQAFSHIGLVNSAHALVSAAGGVWELADLDGKASEKKPAKDLAKESVDKAVSKTVKKAAAKKAAAKKAAKPSTPQPVKSVKPVKALEAAGPRTRARTPRR